MSDEPRAETPPDPEWLTVGAIAQRLSCSRGQVWKYIRAAQFDEVVAFSPRVVRVSHAAYQRFVDRKKNSPRG